MALAVAAVAVRVAVTPGSTEAVGPAARLRRSLRESQWALHPRALPPGDRQAEEVGEVAAAVGYPRKA